MTEDFVTRITEYPTERTSRRIYEICWYFCQVHCIIVQDYIIKVATAGKESNSRVCYKRNRIF